MVPRFENRQAISSCTFRQNNLAVRITTGSKLAVAVVMMMMMMMMTICSLFLRKPQKKHVSIVVVLVY